MAEYYPLLAKAVGSLPNSTPETRRVVYERARKALIGQLRTLHPPVPEEDIERESVELDRAVQRLEGELASGGVPTQAPAAAASAPTPKPAPPPIMPLRPPARPASVLPEASGTSERKPFVPVRTKMPSPRSAPSLGSAPSLAGAPNIGGAAQTASPPPLSLRGTSNANEAPTASAAETTTPPMDTSSRLPSVEQTSFGQVPPTRPVDEMRPAIEASLGTPASTAGAATAATAAALEEPARPVGGENRTRSDMPQRPIAPQPAAAKGAGRRIWILPVGIGVVVAAVAIAAWRLRDTRHTLTRLKPPTEQTAQIENGKIAERVGGAAPEGAATGSAPSAQAPASSAPAPSETAANTGSAASPAPNNPEVPVAQRAALLVEAPEEPNKVKTYLGTVVWKLNNVNAGSGESVGLAVEADIDLPDDKMKATVTFEKNTDASLPASHTIKVRFSMQPGSTTGDVQQISVPQMRQEDSPSGEALAGVTVPVIQNSFLVGLSPGSAEAVNIKQLRDMQWIDIPMQLTSGKIAKLTFEKGTSGQRDLNEAVAAWQKS